MEYDFRARFHLPLTAVGGKIGWGEAVRLVRVLRNDPSSQFATSVEGWDYPLDRSGWMMADLLDIQGGKAIKKWSPYPRPMKRDQPQTRTRRGNAAGRTPEQVKELLRTQFGRPVTAASGASQSP